MHFRATVVLSAVLSALALPSTFYQLEDSDAISDTTYTLPESGQIVFAPTQAGEYDLIEDMSENPTDAIFEDRETGDIAARTGQAGDQPQGRSPLICYDRERRESRPRFPPRPGRGGPARRSWP